MVKTLDDLKGLKISVQGRIEGQTLEALGGSPITLPINEVSALNAYTLPPDGVYLANLPATEGPYSKTVWGEIYWSHTVDIIPNWLTLIGGWTWDYSSATTVPNFSALPWQAMVVPDSTFLHRVGAIFKATRSVSLYALQATSFTPPTGSSLLENEQLPPPQGGKDNELGMKTSFLGGRLSSDLAWFHMTLTNALYVGGLFPNGSGYFVPVGFSREEGVDGDVAFNVVPGWQLITNFYSGHDRDQNNNPVSSTFDNQISFFTRYDFQKAGPLKGFAFGGGLSRVGGRWISTSGLSIPGVTLPSVIKIHEGTLVDTFVTYQLDRHWSFRIACNNILGQVFASGAVNPLTVNANPPRTWYFAGSFKF